MKTKTLSKALDIFLYIIVFTTLITATGTAILKKPFLMTAVRSNSMYPLFQRGDMLLITPISSKTSLNKGDIIIFDPEEGSLASNGVIAHRIYGGNEIGGFITKGDANDYIDQNNDDVPIKKEWITNSVITIGNKPIKMPLLGYIPLLMEKYQKSPFLLPALAVILAAIIGVGEITSSKKGKQAKKNKLEMQLIYFFSGLTVSIMMGASMLAMGQHLTLVYEVSNSTQGVIMGSDVGIMKVGEVIEKPLSDLSNKGFFSMISTSTTDDSQITFSDDVLTLKANQSAETTYKVTATIPGKYESTMHIGMFLPLLPKNIIYSLAKKSYWLALIVISLIPGLPIMLYPIIDSKMRRKTIKEIHRKFRRMKKFFSFNT